MITILYDYNRIVLSVTRPSHEAHSSVQHCIDSHVRAICSYIRPVLRSRTALEVDRMRADMLGADVAPTEFVR